MAKALKEELKGFAKQVAKDAAHAVLGTGVGKAARKMYSEKEVESAVNAARSSALSKVRKAPTTRKQHEAYMKAGGFDGNDQGKLYAASLLFPEECPGARVPDIMMYRSTTKQSIKKLVLTSIQATGTDTSYHICFWVTPFSHQIAISYSTFTNGVPSGTVSYTDNIDSFAGSNYTLQRGVSQVVKIHGETAPLSMSGTGAFIRMPVSARPDANSLSFSTFLSYENTAAIELEPTDKHLDFQYVWMPMATIDTTYVAPTALPASTNSAVVFWLNSNASQTIEVEIITNYEATVGLAAEAGIATQCVMGSEGAASEAISVAAAHPVSQTAQPSSRNVWDWINDISPKIMKYVPIVGDAFSSLGGWVAGLFGKHPERVLMFARTLDDETVRDLRREVDKGRIPAAFVDLVQKLRDMHVFYDGQRAAFHLEDDRVFRVRTIDATRDEWGVETKKTVEVTHGDSGSCPSCPPEWCVPANEFKALEDRVDAIVAANTIQLSHAEVARMCHPASLHDTLSDSDFVVAESNDTPKAAAGVKAGAPVTLGSNPTTVKRLMASR